MGGRIEDQCLRGGEVAKKVNLSVLKDATTRNNKEKKKKVKGVLESTLNLEPALPVELYQRGACPPTGQQAGTGKSSAVKKVFPTRDFVGGG